MKQVFTKKLRLRPDNIDKLVVINGIIEEYLEGGYTMTLRQLYYQLVSRDIISNEQAEYKKLSTLLVKGRMAGIVDWEAIEDRIRVPYLPYWATNPAGAINDIIGQYRRDRQKGQKTYIELWVEKDALSGVLRPITQKYHINLMVTRGYPSLTAIYDAADRIRKSYHDRNTEPLSVKSSLTPTILYIGDHDPSGLDMIRDIQDRLNGMFVTTIIKPLAITREQIDEYKPPPNPAKFKDPRAGDYIKEHGRSSWEVDALNPNVLQEIITTEIESIMDMTLYNKILSSEEEDIIELQGVAGAM